MRKFLILLVLLLLPAIVRAQSYTTNFPATENPISQGGQWINGGTVGLDWSNVQTTGGAAYGTVISGGPPYNDSIAMIKPPAGFSAWGQDQTVTGTVVGCTAGGSSVSVFKEISIFLRFNITAHNAKGFGADWSCNNANDAQPYYQFGSWCGPINAFAGTAGCPSPPAPTFTNGGPGLGVVNGDVISVSLIGNVVTMKKNGNIIAQSGVGGVPFDNFDTAPGDPGIGFYLQTKNTTATTAMLTDHGLTNVTATSNTTNYCNNQIYQTFEGGATGAQPAAADLQATSFGGSAVTWVGAGSSTITYSGPTNDMRALVAPGRLCGDSTTYTNAVGQHALQMQFDGGADFFQVQANYAPASDVVVSFEYNEDFAQTDFSKIDTVSIGNNLYGSIAFNAYGNGGRYYSLEVTGQAAPNISWNPSQSCPCKVTMHFRTGTATTGGLITLNVQDKNGVQLTPISVTSNVGVNTSSFIRFGDQCNCAAPTAGKHVWYDNAQISFDGSIPGQFCAGSSPNWTSSPDSATLQGCLTGATAGDTVNILSGTATWSGAVVTNTNGVSMAGATTCSNTGTSSASCVDNSMIFWNNTTATKFFTANVPASGTMTLSGLTFNFTGGTLNNSQVAMTINGSGWPVPSGPNPNGFRITNSHIIANSSSQANGTVFAIMADAYGVVDHILYQRLAGPGGMFEVDGDKGAFGYNAWLTPVALGSNQAVYFDTNTWLDTIGSNSEGPYDGYAGCRTVFRFNYVLNTHNGGNHGTDSGPWRGCMVQESYGNTYANNLAGNPGNSFQTLRSGTGITFGDVGTHSGTAGPYGAIGLQCLRCDPNQRAGNNWGSHDGWANGTPWLTRSTNTGTVQSVQLASNVGAWAGNHAYTANSASTANSTILPTSGNAGGFVFTTFANCTSGGTQPGAWNQTIGQTTADGTCTWENSSGATATGGNGVFCGPANLDTLVALGGTCPGADTPTFFWDSGAGVNSHGYPSRDNVGRVHTTTQGQFLAPVYAWLNTTDGAQVAFSVTQGTFTDAIVQNRDYYAFQASCGSPQTTGVCSGTLAAMPTSCTKGVAYWASNEGNWNTSGNSFGNGTLHICGAGGTYPATCTATVLNSCYVPLAYPYPGGSAPPVVSVSPSSENFGGVVVGASSSTQTATLTNPTAASITITSVTTTGNTADFPNDSNSCSGTIAANGGQCAVVTHFSPTSTGARNATLTIATSVGSFPVALSGTGTSAVNPGVSISPASLAFGNISVGSSSAAQTVTITSTTSANLVMGTPPATITGAGFSIQAIGGQCTNGQSIPQSSTCVESVVFTPTSAGAVSGSLNIFDNVTGSPQVVSLTGTGVGTIALNPISINFGSVAQGQTSPAQTLTMTNNTGFTLTLTGTTFTNTTPIPGGAGGFGNQPFGNFSYGDGTSSSSGTSPNADWAATSNTCNTGTLANGASCTMTITFRPSSTTGTNETGTVSISYTGVGGSPAVVPLAGTVLPPLVTPNTAIFAITVTGSGFVPGSVVYQNGVPCPSSTYVSPTQMSAMCPVTATIVVNNPVVLSSVRVNSGGPGYVDTTGNTWSADNGFSGGAATAFPATTPITGTTEPTLYKTERWASNGFSYTFPVLNGNYNVVLRFVENYYNSAGNRIFNVKINGTQVLTNFDIWAVAGAQYKAVDKAFPVTVTGGSINIQFVNDAAVAAISILGS